MQHGSTLQVELSYLTAILTGIIVQLKETNASTTEKTSKQ